MAQPFIQIVDDNKITLKLLRKYLEANGFEVDEAYDGIDCLEKVDARKPDAIVLDVMMPRLDGYETVKRLKENSATQQIPVIIVTALNDVANQIKSIDAGADDFLSKPIEEKLLIAKVRLLANWAIEVRTNCLKDIINKAISGEYSFGGKTLEAVLTDANYQ